MKNKTRRLAAFLLSAAVVITAVPGMQERVYAQKTGGLQSFVTQEITFFFTC